MKIITVQLEDDIYNGLKKVAGNEPVPDYVEKLLRCRAKASEERESVAGWITLDEPVPLRPPGYFAAQYADAADATFEERICRDSKPVIEE